MEQWNRNSISARFLRSVQQKRGEDNTEFATPGYNTATRRHSIAEEEHVTAWDPLGQAGCAPWSTSPNIKCGYRWELEPQLEGDTLTMLLNCRIRHANVGKFRQTRPEIPTTMVAARDVAHRGELLR